MTIAAQCGSCRKRFAAKEKLAGRKVKCPQCGAVLTIPQLPPEPEPVQQISDLMDEIPIASAPSGETASPTDDPARSTGSVPYTGLKCSSCGASLAAGSVVCIECGYNRLTGKKREVSGPEESNGHTFPWLQVSVVAGACLSLAAVVIIGYIMFQPRAAVGVGSSGASETPKEFVEVEFGQRDYICECPKDWIATSGGGKDGIPPWTKFENGGASVQIRDSLSGTPGGTLQRSLKIGTAIERGEASVDDVHRHRKQFVAESMRNYDETDQQKLDHRLGDALIAELTAKPMFGEAIRGYRATVLHEFHQFNILCLCTESDWEMLKPAFKHVISTLEPIELEEFPGM